MIARRNWGKRSCMALLVGSALVMPLAATAGPTQTALVNGATILSQVQLESFTASPDHVRAFQPVSLTWRVRVPAVALNLLRLQLNIGGGTNVGAQGSLTVTPTATTTYTLTAISPPFSKILAARTVTVDTSQCSQGSLPEDVVRSLVRAQVDSLLADPRNRLIYKRGPDYLNLEIQPTGIRVRLALKANIGGPDPDVNVDALIFLWAENGTAKYWLANFSADVDYGFFLANWVAKILGAGGPVDGLRQKLTSVIDKVLAENLTPLLRGARLTRG